MIMIVQKEHGRRAGNRPAAPSSRAGQHEDQPEPAFNVRFNLRFSSPPCLAAYPPGRGSRHSADLARACPACRDAARSRAMPAGGIRRRYVAGALRNATRVSTRVNRGPARVGRPAGFPQRDAAPPRLARRAAVPPGRRGRRHRAAATPGGDEHDGCHGDRPGLCPEPAGRRCRPGQCGEQARGPGMDAGRARARPGPAAARRIVAFRSEATDWPAAAGARRARPASAGHQLRDRRGTLAAHVPPPGSFKDSRTAALEDASYHG
jgi:hypothetical protein